MIAIDTNIVVRLLTGDDKLQLKKAVALFESNEIFIPDSVILESEWVLRFAYHLTPVAVGNAFSKLFGLVNVHTDNPVQIAQAVYWHEQGMDFADALHLAYCQRYEALFTSDYKFIRKAKDLGDCPVVKP